MNNTHQFTETFGLPWKKSESNTVTHNEDYLNSKTYYGYTQDINVSSDYIDGEDNDQSYKYHRDVAVLTITPSTINTDKNKSTVYEKDDPSQVGYIYKCTDFAPGKQWVTVYVSDDNYTPWKQQEELYNTYQQNIKKYRRILDSYALIVGCEQRTTTDLYADREYEVAILDTIYARLVEQSDNDNKIASEGTGAVDNYVDYRSYIKDRLLRALDDKELIAGTKLSFDEEKVKAINYLTKNETILGYCQSYLDAKFQYALQNVSYELPSADNSTYVRYLKEDGSEYD
jgi:hypothetical protein